MNNCIRFQIRSILVLSSFLITSVLTFDTTANVIIGLNPALQEHYNFNTIKNHSYFTCLDKTKQIKIEKINDDYCDCLDGSDEPGTSACATGTFYCLNKGFKPKIIPSIFVNDNICDCCDGSDEFPGTCDDTCLVLGMEIILELQKNIEIYGRGILEKKIRADNADSLIKDWNLKFEDLSNEIKDKKEYIEKLSETIEILEKKDEITSSDSDELNSSNETESFTNEDQDKLDEDTINELDDESEYNEVYVKEEEEEREIFNDDDKSQKNEKMGLSLSNLQKNILDGVETIKSKIFPRKKEKMEKIHHSRHKRSSETEELKEARRKHSDEKRGLRDLEKELDNLETKINMEYGKDKSYTSLAGKCYEIKEDKYIYEMCLFDKASQKEGGRATTELGKWQNFSDDYKKMEFEKGTRCSGIISRTFTVDLVCGEKDEFIYVKEPQMCQYVAKFKTPCACDVVEYGKMQKELKYWRNANIEIKDEL